MKGILLFLLFLVSSDQFGQSWYSKIVDPLNGKQESATVMLLGGDTLYIRANTLCSGSPNLCSEVGRYSIGKNEFIDFKQFDDIQAGGKNLLFNFDKLVLASQESTLNNNVSVSEISRLNLEYLNSFNLKIQNSRYFSYTIKNSITYKNKYIIGAQALDSLMFIGYQGWNNYQENAILFVLNSALDVDTTLVIPPTSGAFLKIEDMGIGPDSVLYVSFFEKYLKHGSSNDFLEIHKVIYGFDENYKIVFQWIGPDFDNQESLSCIAFGIDSTIYLNYRHDFHDYLLALKPDGSTKWECLLDSAIGLNLYNIRKIIVSKNGDIIGSGVISSVIDELGESGFLFRINPNGTLKWKRAFRVNKGFDLTVPEIFPFQTGLEDITELPDGELMAVGYVRKYVGSNQPDGPYNFDIWLLRTSPEGCLSHDCSYIQEIVSKNNYIPLVTSSNEWVVDVYIPSFPTLIQRYSFSNDSFLIDGEYFQELLYGSGMSGSWENTGEYMRQENGKVFKIGGLIGPLKKLLYDFDFSVGDTLLPHSDGSQNHREIIQVGTTKLLDDVPRKFIVLECTSEGPTTDTTIWIEGMGDVKRLFWTESFCSTIDGDGTTTSIRCFSTNGQLLYLRPDLEGCYTTAVNDPEIGNVEVYPNPSSDILHFELNDDLPIERILIYSSVGKLALSTNTISTENNLDISELSSGFYIGVIYFRNKHLKVFKVVVTN